MFILSWLKEKRFWNCCLGIPFNVEQNIFLIAKQDLITSKNYNVITEETFGVNLSVTNSDIWRKKYIVFSRGGWDDDLI